MTESSVVDRGDTRAAAEDLELPVARVLAAAERLTQSVDPDEVFSSLVRGCVPLLGDACEVRLSTEGGDELRFPSASWTATGSGGAQQLITLPIALDQVEGAPELPGLRGQLTVSFAGRPASAAHRLAVQFLLDRALGILCQQRQLITARALRERAANLSLALETNREIGIALGIVMYQTKLSSEQAFDLLRRTSQASHRKLREVAADIAETGMLALPPGVALVRRRSVPRPGPALRRH